MTRSPAPPDLAVEAEPTPVEPTPVRLVPAEAPTPVGSTAAETPPTETTPAEASPAETSSLAAPTAADIARLRVHRRKQGDAKAHFDDFEVTLEPGATVLDALLEIRRSLDPSLVVRHSCMHGSCGACGVRVNGRAVLACDTPLGRPRRRVTIEPLSGQRLIADLATDMVDFHSRMAEVDLPTTRAAEMPAGVAPPEGIRAFTRFENCIECGLCLAACPVAASDGRYLGPAALAAGARLVEEPRGRDLGPVLALASEPDSVWRCRDAMECSAVCPSAVEPATAVISLRRRVAGGGLGRLLGRRT
jgi:succinate dehydrogenase / fumarate reductase, iron-sulfur subunit